MHKVLYFTLLTGLQQPGGRSALVPPLQPGQPPTLDSRSSRCRKAATAYQRGSFFSGARIAAAAVRPALDVHQLMLQLEAIVRTGPVH